MPGPYESFRDIPEIMSRGAYSVGVGFANLRNMLEEFSSYSGGLDLDPDYQRGHVWSEAQQIAFVEYALRGGTQRSGGDLLFNCTTWDHGCSTPIELVDGKQRLTAMLRFLDGEIPAFDKRIGEYDGRIDTLKRFTVHVNNLPTRASVLAWYIDLNAGGTVHAPEEISRVRGLLEDEAQAESAPAPGR